MSCIVLATRCDPTKSPRATRNRFVRVWRPRYLASRPSWRRVPTASGLRRYWVPGVAVAASAAAVAFIAVPLMRAPETVSVAKNSPPAAIEVGAQKSLPTIVNARGLSPSFNPYLAAHRELIGNSVVPRATVYLRSAEDR